MTLKRHCGGRTSVSWTSLGPDVNNRADRPRPRGCSINDQPPCSLLYTFLTYSFHLCYKYISIYCIYMQRFIFSRIHFYHFKKCVFHISWTIFLAVIQLCILYTHIVFSNKILPMYYFKCHTCSFCESLQGGESERRHGLAAPVLGAFAPT